MVKKDDQVTKGFLKKTLEKKINDFRDEVKTMFGKMRDENTEMFGKMRDENTEMKDTILGELKAMREDFDAHSFQHQTTNDTLDNHETRLRKLEKPTL